MEVWLPATPRLLLTTSFASGHDIFVCHLPLPLSSPLVLAALLLPAAVPRVPWWPLPLPPADSGVLAAAPAAASAGFSVALLVRLSGLVPSPFSARVRNWVFTAGGAGVRLTFLRYGGTQRNTFALRHLLSGLNRQSRPQIKDVLTEVAMRQLYLRASVGRHTCPS